MDYGTKVKAKKGNNHKVQAGTIGVVIRPKPGGHPGRGYVWVHFAGEFEPFIMKESELELE